MTKQELLIRSRDAGWKPDPTKRGNASIAARDRRVLLRVIDGLRAFIVRAELSTEPTIDAHAPESWDAVATGTDGAA